MCLAQGHNAVTPVRLEPAASRSRVKHSTTEPLRSLNYVQKKKWTPSEKNFLDPRMVFITCKHRPDATDRKRKCLLVTHIVLVLKRTVSLIRSFEHQQFMQAAGFLCLSVVYSIAFSSSTFRIGCKAHITVRA